MEKRWCNACGQAFEPRAQSPRQAYCPKDSCQQARKRLWQQTKRSTDYGYYENQVKSQEHWRRKNSDYWRQYREDHPAYAAANREKQRLRNARQRQSVTVIANSDASSSGSLTPGIYRLVDLEAPQRGIRREWLVQLFVVKRS